MWRSVFLHEFIDHRITNCQALAGRPTPASLALAANDAALPGTNAVPIRRGDGFEYLLDAPLSQVIGVSCRVRLMYPLNPQPFMFPVIRLGAGAELLLWPQTHPLPDLSGTLALARLWLGSSFKNLGNIVLPAQRFVDFRLDWHTSGQARILADGQLVAYANAVSPGAMLTVDRVAFGMLNLQPAATPPVYHLSRVFVRVLQRPDSLAHLSKLLPRVKVADENRCHARAVGNILAQVDALRQFMAQIHQSLSQNWSAQAGPAAGPFKPEAVEAHALSTEAVAALAGMLRTSDFAETARFLEPFEKFLRILHDTLPQQFAALAAQLDGTKVVPEDCHTAYEKALNDNSATLGPLVKLMTEASDRVRSIAAGN